MKTGWWVLFTLLSVFACLYCGMTAVDYNRNYDGQGIYRLYDMLFVAGLGFVIFFLAMYHRRQKKEIQRSIKSYPGGKLSQTYRIEVDPKTGCRTHIEV